MATAHLGNARALPKLRSWLALYALGMPTLDAVILWSGEPEALAIATAFANSRGYSELLVRSDAQVEVWPYPRGGFLVPVATLRRSLELLLDAGRTVWLHEPASPLKNRYSMNGLAWSGDEDLVVEIVGPGFDASDLKRGDITPHERYVLSRPDLKVVRHTVVDTKQYNESWHRRLTKVRETLRSTFLAISKPLDPEPAQSAYDGEPGTQYHHEQADQRHSGVVEPPVDWSRGYRPIDPRAVQGFAIRLHTIGSRLSGIGLLGEPLALSMSQVDNGIRDVYWDVVWPTLKAPRL